MRTIFRKARIKVFADFITNNTNNFTMQNYIQVEENKMLFK